MNSTLCQHPACTWDERVSQCDNCDSWFCPDHGSHGGDRSYGDYTVAVPAVCWKCGGFNVDEE